MWKHKCPKCGNVMSGKFPTCYSCYKEARDLEVWRDVMNNHEPNDYDPSRELPESEYCVTCGREWGTSLRSDGKYYCTTCWTVWNS